MPYSLLKPSTKSNRSLTFSTFLCHNSSTTSAILLVAKCSEHRSVANTVTWEICPITDLGTRFRSYQKTWSLTARHWLQMNLIHARRDRSCRILSAIKTLIAGHGTMSETFISWDINSETGLSHPMTAKGRIVDLSSNRGGMEFTLKLELLWTNWIQDKTFCCLLVMDILEEGREKHGKY